MRLVKGIHNCTDNVYFICLATIFKPILIKISKIFSIAASISWLVFMLGLIRALIKPIKTKITNLNADFNKHYIGLDTFQCFEFTHD